MNLFTRLKSFLFRRTTEFPTVENVDPTRPLVVFTNGLAHSSAYIHCPYCKTFVHAELYTEHLDTCEPLFWEAYEQLPKHPVFPSLEAFAEAVESLDYTGLHGEADPLDTRPIYGWDNPEESYRDDPRDKNSQWGEPF